MRQTCGDTAIDKLMVRYFTSSFFCYGDIFHRYLWLKPHKGLVHIYRAMSHNHKKVMEYDITRKTTD